MINVETKFRPIIGTEEQINKLTSYRPGSIYFSSDSGKMFLATEENQKVSLGGGGVSLFYGTQKTVEMNVEGRYPISFDSIDSESEQPKEDDLILNADGGFYKVIEINNDDSTYYCSIIAVSGSGGSSGGGGSSSSSSMTAKATGITSYSNWIVGKEKNIKVTIKSAEDTTVVVSYTLKNTYGGETTSKTYGPNILTSTTGEFTDTFDLGSKIKLGTSSLTISISADNGGTLTLNPYSSLSGVVMDIQDSQNFNNKGVFSGDIDFRCIILGEGIERKLTVYIDGQEYTSLDVTAYKDNSEITIPIEAQTHGTHILKAELAESNGQNPVSLTYQIGCIETGNTLPVIWLGNYSTSITNYENMDIPYMVYNPEDPDRADINLYLNGTLLASGSQTISYDRTAWKNWRVVGYIVGTNTLTISCGGTSKTFSVLVNADLNRDLDIIKSGLILNLDAEGRTNSENITSRNVWESNLNGYDSKVSFNDFNWYNNGWHTDDDGNTCLRISNGASIKIPLNVMNQNKLSNSYVFEFVFKLRNLQRYTSLIKTSVVTDESGDNAKVTKTVSGTDGVWLNYYNDGRGFCLGTQEAFLKSQDVAISCKYKEDELIHLSLVVEDGSISSVPLMYIYLNGLMTNIATYNPDTDNFNTGSNLDAISINSNYCDIDLYKVRAYNTALTHSNIVHNYISDYKDIDLYDVNNDIVEYDSKGTPNINYAAMVEYNENNPDNLLMPYMVIETTDVNNILPYKKAEDTDQDPAWTVNLKFVNNELDYAYENGEITGDEYLHSVPSFEATGVTLNVQGTSSQGYPRRNYSSKLKKAKTWIYTNGPEAGNSVPTKTKDGKTTFKGIYFDGNIKTNRFTWKVDYMESSGSCNGGLASFLQSVYSKHPVQDYGISQDVAADFRTSVYGFPMMVFHEYHGGTYANNPKYEFIGRYNLLLDKGCDDNFGFTVDGDSFIVDSTAEDGTKTYKSLADAAECWQIEDNTGGRCSFKDYSLDKTRIDDSGRIILTITDDFSYRYHPDKDNLDNAMDRLGDYSSDEAANTYLKSKYTRLSEMLKWVSSTDVSSSALVAMGSKLDSPITYNGTEYEYDTKEYRLAKFKNEFEEHFDLEYTEVYFIITELLICYDSRGKNLMLATWGPHEEGGNDIWYPIFYDMDTQLGINNSGVPYWDYYEEPTNNGTFSTNDSVLWNNFWTCFEAEIKAKYNALRDQKLTISNLDGYYRFDPLISNSYAMKGQRPLIMENVDEYYKYIDCTTRGAGFTDTNGDSGIYSDIYLYCLQGDRKLQRSLFLRNRFNYLDSQWVAGDHGLAAVKNYQQRIGANYGFDLSTTPPTPMTSDKYLNRELSEEEIAAGYIQVDSPKANTLDANWDFTITPYLKQYVNMYVDDTALNPIKTEDGESQSIDLYNIEKHKETLDKTANKQQQLVYFPGISYLSSLGDLSLKYFDKIDLAKATHLKDLLLGSEREGYFNNNLLADSFKPADQAKTSDGTENANAKTMLEKVVLSNLGQLSGTYDFSGSEKIKEFRALGTNISCIVFADGVQLQKLYLPETISNLILKEPTALTGYSTNGKGTIVDTTTGDKEFDDGIYIEGLNNIDVISSDTLTHLNSINIIGGKMGYNSYRIIDKVIKIKASMAENWNSFTESIQNSYSRKLSLNLEDIEWSPYRQVEYGESLISGATYVKKTEHYTFESYQYTTEEQWNLDLLNEKVYQYTESEDQDILTDLSLLDAIIDSYENDNYIESTTQYEDGRKTLPYISGRIFVANENGDKISESVIRNKYLEYWPDLEIYAANVEESYTVKFISVENNIETIINTQKFDKNDTDIVIQSPTVPVKSNYEFIGWKDESGNIVRVISGTTDTCDLSSYKFSSSKTDYVFEAQYQIKQYNINIASGAGASGTELTVDSVILENGIYIDNVLGNYKDRIDSDSWKYSARPTYNSTFGTNDYQENATYRYEYYGMVPYKVYRTETGTERTFDSLSSLQEALKSHFSTVFNVDSLWDIKIDHDIWFMPWFYKVDATQKVIEENNLNHFFVFENLEDGTIAISTNSSDSISRITKNISLPKTYSGKDITVIRNFKNVGDIKYINWPEGCAITKIEDSAFANIGSLKISNYNSLLQNTLTYIGENAFYNSHSQEPNDILNTIIIPENVIYIGAHAFENLYIRKKDLMINSTNLTIGEDAFIQTDPNSDTSTAYAFNDVTVSCNEDEINGKVSYTGTLSCS